MQDLSRRERQIMDIIFERGEATAAEVRGLIADAPSYSSIRALLRILEEKGHLKHKTQGPRYIYFPTTTARKAQKNALKHVMKTFFDNSTENVVAALIDISAKKMSGEELDRLSAMIEKARKEGR